MSDFDELARQLEEDRERALREVERYDKLIAQLKGANGAEDALTTDLKGFATERLLDWDWLFGGVIPTGSTGILAGDPKVGKSTLVTQMALCLAAGRTPFYDCHVNRAARVLYIAAEGARAAYQNRVKTAARTLGISLTGSEASRWFIQQRHANDYMLGSRGLRKMIAESKPDLVVLDTLFFFTKGNENDASDTKAHIMRPARALTAEFGCGFLFVHHQTKESAERKGPQRVRGSTALLGDCDYLLQLDAVAGDTVGNKRTLALSLTKYAATRRWDLIYAPEEARFG